MHRELRPRPKPSFHLPQQALQVGPLDSQDREMMIRGDHQEKFRVNCLQLQLFPFLWSMLQVGGQTDNSEWL